jgi:sulfatase maturation enzyme AslB (radical SAM superfamily)
MPSKESWKMIRPHDIPKMNYRFNKLYEGYMAKLKPYPRNKPFSAVNLEVTTYCNSKCDFCAYERIIGGGIRPRKHISLERAQQSVDYLAAINGGDYVLKYIPVGLGESILHPQFPELLRMGRKAFPNATIFNNTNGIALSGDRAKNLICEDLDVLTLSMCFVDEKDYEARLHTKNYKKVCENFERFLKMKGDSKPSCKLHVFDLPVNKKNLWKWVLKWSPLLNDNDHLSIYEFVDLISTELRDEKSWPCEEMIDFDSILVDIEGNLFPCCSGIWKENYKEVILGNIDDGHPELIVDKLKAFKNAPPSDTCIHCTRLETKKRYYDE